MSDDARPPASGLGASEAEGRLEWNEAAAFRPGTRVDSARRTMVPVPFKLLRSLQGNHAQLDSYVRVYIAAEERIDRCDDVLSWLSGQDVPLDADDLWRRIQQSLESIGYMRGIRAVGAVPEPAARLVGEFDEALTAAVKQVQRVRNPAESLDTGAVANDVYQLTNEMRDSARQLAATCKENSQEWLEQTRSLLERIFDRIEDQIEGSLYESNSGEGPPVTLAEEELKTHFDNVTEWRRGADAIGQFGSNEVGPRRALSKERRSEANERP